MIKLTEWIAAHPSATTWISLISVIGVIITLIALIIQIIDKKRRSISYLMTSTVLLYDNFSKLDDVKILYKENIIDNLVVSNIKIWNSGNEIIEEKDFYPDYPLKLVIPGNEQILASTIDFQSEDTCKVHTNINNKNEVIISFYCLEPKQSAIINVYHTNIDEKRMSITGKLKQGKIINKYIETGIDDGKIFISNGRYKISFSNSILNRIEGNGNFIQDFFGISVSRIKKKK